MAELPAGTAAAAFLPADIEQFRGIVTDTPGQGQRRRPGRRDSTDHRPETAWDDAQARLQLMNDTAWSFLDARIDAALKAVRAAKPDADAGEAGTRRAIDRAAVMVLSRGPAHRSAGAGVLE